MAEYIEREAVLKKCGWYNTVNDKSICAIRKDEIVAIPADDVVEVVRCRDCKHWDRFVGEEHKGFCFAWKFDSYDEDFCSYGERKDGDTDG